MKAAKHEVKIAVATLILVVYTLTLSMLNQAMSLQGTHKPISNTGSVKGINVGVYWDTALTNAVSSIDWGILEPGSSKNVTVYIQNKGNSVATLTMSASNWIPSNASNYMDLSWDYNGQSINVNEYVQVTLTLSVSASIEGITNFSFDIVIVGSG